MKFDIDSARKAGYSDDEIADYLATQNKFDLSGALKSGYSASDVIGFLSGGGAPAEPVTDTGDETARLAARYKAPSLVERASSALPRPVDPLGIGRGQPLGATPVRAQEPVRQRAAPTPYRDKREALDDAVNLLEEGAPQADVRSAFEKGGIKFDEIVAHGKKRGSEYFKQQTAPAVDPEVQRLLKRAPAPVTGEIKSTRSEENFPGADVALAGAKGAVTGFKLLMSAGGAGGRPTSMAEKALETADQYLEGLRSAAAVRDDERIGQIMEQAKSGTWSEQVVAAAKAASVAPASLIAQGLGTSVPVILTSLLPGVRESTVARLTAQIGLGAAQGAGATKESIYSAVRDDMLRAGVPRIEAEERAKAAQSYLGQNKDQIAIGMALGALASSTGVERVIPINQVSKVLAKSGASKAIASAEQNVIGRGLIGGVSEAVPEFLQGSAEQVAQNVALQREGRDIPTFQGAVGSGTLEALAGFGAGAVTNAAFGRPITGEEQIASAINREIADTEFSVPASEVAADLLNPNSYDQRQISPTETVRPGQMMTFTEPNSATAQAGLTPIVVPVAEAPVADEVPTVGQINPETERAFGLDQLRMGAANVGTSGVAGRATAAGGQLSGDLSGAGVGDAGLAGVNAAGTAGAGTGGVVPVGGETAPVGGASVQQPAGVTPQGYNNAVAQPVEQWFGRKGDGYSTEADAQQALPGRKRMFNDLDWKIEPMPNGKFRLAGYSQETDLGTQAPQALQAEAQRQEAPAAGAGPIAATGAAAAPAQLQGGRVPGLTPAPTAPLRDFATFQKAVAADGIEIAPVRAAEMTTQHQIASAVARVLGKTYTVARVTSGDPMALSNGMIDKLGGKHIVTAENSEDAPLFVAVHEAYHGLPQQQRKALNTQLLQLFRAENKDRFLKEFNYNEAQFDEEAPAFMAQVLSKRADFWEELRDKMGNREFADVAKLVLGTLNQIVRKVTSQYGQDFADTYITDIVKARDLLTTAYTEAMQAQGLTADVEADSAVMASQRSEIGAKLQQRIDTDFDGAAQEYSQLRGAKGGRVLDADVARELSPEYRKDRTRSAEVHEAASSLIQREYERRMATVEPMGEVVFMAGGGGSGKSSAESLLAPILERAHTVYDSTLSNYDKAERNIQMALDAGQLVNVAYVYRDPEEALRNGVLTRAMRAGRTVPIDALVKGHAGSSEVVRRLQEKFGNNPRFSIKAVDNSRGPGNAVVTDLTNITPVIKSGLKERFENAAREEFEAGRISEAVYRSVAGGQADTRAGAQGEAADAGVRQAVQGRIQGRAGSERAGDPVSKDEAVVDGVVYSSKRRNLVDIPTIEFKDLVGKKVVGIKADLTDAGRSYTGIDGSQLEFPVEMMGGPNYVRLPENFKANVVWAVRGGATLTKIMEQVKKSDYVLVHAMNGNSHLTNSTISTAYLQTVEAYLRDGRISKDNLKALDDIVRSPKNKSSLPDFPGFESPEIYSYIDGLSFDQRGALAQMLEKKEAQVHGLPNLERFRRETIDADFAGYRQGDAMLVIKVDKENPTVKLGEEGTKLHPSYPLGLRGTVIGKLAKGVNYEMIFRDYFKFAVPNFKNKEAGAWYAFDRKMPIQKITKEIAESVAPGGYSAIKTARQAEAALNFANNNWLVSGKTKAQGGISVQEFVDALRANDGAAALTLYSPDEVKAGIKDKSFTIYQLGKEGGDKGLQVFFGLKRGAPWYKDMIDGVTDSEVEVVSVTNNESGAPGIGIPAIITKAISEGATVLDAFAVKSDRFPSGFLPEMYAQFGFEEIGRIPFDPSYYDANGLADLKAFWSRGGWKESDGFPDVVVMRWKGNDEDRAAAVERYVRSGATSVPRQGVVGTRAAAADARGKRDGKGAGARGRRSADIGATGGDQGAGDAASVVSRAFGSIQELATLGDGDIRNLGLDPAEIQRLRDELAGVQRSNRPAAPAGRSGLGSDKGDAVKVDGAIHYGRQAGLSVLSGVSFGSGIRGAEQARLSEPGVDPRIKRRVYFYLPVAGGIPAPEMGLGANVYTASLSNLYDPSAGSRSFPSDPNAFESAVLDAGFRGYINREQGTAVVLNSDVPVKFMGPSSEQRVLPRNIQRIVPKVVTRTEGDELVRKPTNDEMIGIIKARPALATAAPSFKLQFGDARVSAAEAEAADRALADAGASFQFGEVMRSNRVTDTAAFKRWFGDSKVVDANGQPLVVYRGAANDEGAEFANNKDYIYTTSSAEYAKNFAEGRDGANTSALYLSLQNPLDLTQFGDKKVSADEFGKFMERSGVGYKVDPFIANMKWPVWQFFKRGALKKELEDAGYDGIVWDEKRTPDYRGGSKSGRSYIAFDPTQIKSATGNEGTFDPENPSILKSNRATDSWFLGRDELGRIKLGAGAKAYRAVADVASNVLDKVGMKPISTELGRAMRQMKVEINNAREITADVAGKLSELSEQERAMISDVIEGELKRGVKPPKRVLEVAASMQNIMSEQTAELVRLGMLSEDAAGRWDGKYLPRFYESKLKDEGKAWAKAAKAMMGKPKTMQGIRGASLKGRGLFQTVPVEELESWLAEGWEERDPNFDPDTDTEITVWRDYTREERENMGEIRDSMFRFIMGYNKSQRDISLGRLYESLANTIASKSEKEGFVQVPKTNVEDTYARRYGKLAGKWVPKEVMDHLGGFDEANYNDLLAMYRKAMSMWKEGKTVLNPVSHANNVLSNVTMAHFAGVSYWDVNKYLAATRDIVKNAPMLKEAKDAGLWLGTMNQSELVQMLPDQLKVLAAKSESKAGAAVDTVWNAMAFWLRKPMSKAYEAEDLFFRYLIYRDARQRGVDPTEAVEYAQKYIFTYDDLPRGARRVRDYALPFFAYTYKVVPALAQVALEQPWRLAAPAAALYAANAAMYAIAAGADDEDWMELIKRYITDPDFREKAKAMEADERVNLPPWMKGSTAIGTPKAIRLGTDEVTGLPVFLDLSRVFPGGDLFDAHNNAGGVPLLAPITPSHPILNTAAAMLFNKDTFRGTDIVKKSDTDEEAAAKRAKWTYQQIAPAIAIGNGHFDRAMNVIANVTGEPLNLYFTEYTGVGKDGLPVQPGYSAMQTVGIKARPIDLETSAAIQKAQENKLVREIEAEIRSAQRLERKGALTSDQADRIIERQKEKRQRLKEGLTVDGDEKE